MLGSKIMNLPRADFYPTKKVNLGYAAQIFKKLVKIKYQIKRKFKTIIEKLSIYKT